MGRIRHTIDPQDGIVIHGLIEYMPDRIAVSMLRVAKSLLADGGVVFISAFRSKPRPLSSRPLAVLANRSPKSGSHRKPF